MINFETVSHVGVLDCNRGVGLNETNNPKDQSKDQRAGGQHQPPRQPHRGAQHLLLLIRLLGCLDRDHIDLPFGTEMTHPWLLERLICGMHDHLQERDCHCEEHPNVNHLDIRGDRQTLRQTQETEEQSNWKILCTSNLDLHGCQDQKNGEINLNCHLNVVLGKEPSCVADDKEKDGREKNCQKVAHDWPSKGDLNYNNLNLVHA